MVEAPYLMGIDFGTGGVRVGLFDRAGTPVVFRAETFPTQYPRPSWAEQDPGDWWLGLVTAVRGAVNDSCIAPRDIAGISVDATSSTSWRWTDTTGTWVRRCCGWTSAPRSSPTG